MSRRLVGGIPRAFTSHKTATAAAYRRYVVASVNRLLGAGVQAVPADFAITLREAGRLATELQATGQELEAARARGRRRDVSRLRRALIPMRTQLIKLEERLEQLAKSSPQGDAHSDLARRLRSVQA